MSESLKIPYGSQVMEVACTANLLLLQAQSSTQAINYLSMIPSLFNPLREMVESSTKITIIISDGTRNTASQVWLPILIDTLIQSGAQKEHISFLVACGSHRPSTEVEQKRILGEGLYGCFSIVDHNARDNKNFVMLGTTDQGTPVEVNRLAVESDLLIVTGIGSMHYFAGFGGGAKSILPGISGWETIKANHFLNFLSMRRNPLCRAANDLDNPLFQDMQQAARMLPISFMINSTTESTGSLSGLYAGRDWERVAADTRRAVEKQYYTQSIEQKADWVLVSSGGEPYDLNLIQAHKAIEFASYAVKPGGTIVAFVRCREGIGSPQVLKYLESRDLDEFFNMMKADYHPHGQCAFAMKEKCERFRVILFTELEDGIVRAFGAEKANSPQEAIDMVLRGLPSNATGYLIPHGHHTLPRCK